MRGTRFVILLGLACAVGAHAAEPLPDRRAVRPGGPPVSGAAPSPTQQTLIDLLTQLEALQTELRQLRGQLEVQNHEMERLKNRQRDATADFDRRLIEIERRGSSGAAAAPPGGSTTITTPAIGGGAPRSAAPAPPAGPLTPGEQQAYDAAFALIKQGLYDRAAASFREFITRYPKSRLADGAQYWIGEAAYAQRNYKGAREEFEKVLTEYPNSAKTADAMLKIGYCQYELGAFDKAREVLTQVTTRYPNTSVAKSAEVRLAKMSKEGR